MDGQDLLSAALDECGLGDLFSINPSDEIVVQEDSISTKSIVSTQLSQQDINGLFESPSSTLQPTIADLNSFVELQNSFSSSNDNQHLVVNNGGCGIDGISDINGSLSQIVTSSDSLNLVSTFSNIVDNQQNQSQQQQFQPQPQPQQQTHIFTAANSTNSTTPVQITKVKKIVIRKLPSSSLANISTASSSPISSSSSTTTTSSHNLSSNIITGNNSNLILTGNNGNRANIVTLTSSSSSSPLLNSNHPSQSLKSIKPLIISPQIVTLDNSNNHPTTTTITNHNGQIRTTTISTLINNISTTSAISTTKLLNNGGLIDNHSTIVPTVNLNPISQIMQTSNRNVITAVNNNNIIRSNSSNGVVRCTNNNNPSQSIAFNSIRKTANGPIIIRTNSKLSAAAVTIRQKQQVVASTAAASTIKLVPMRTGPQLVQQTSSRAVITSGNGITTAPSIVKFSNNGIVHSQSTTQQNNKPQYQTVQFVNTKLSNGAGGSTSTSASISPNILKNGTVSFVPSTTTAISNLNSLMKSTNGGGGVPIGTKYIAANIIKSNTAATPTLLSTPPPLSNPQSIVSKNPLITVKSVGRPQSLIGGSAQSQSMVATIASNNNCPNPSTLISTNSNNSPTIVKLVHPQLQHSVPIVLNSSYSSTTSSSNPFNSNSTSSINRTILAKPSSLISSNSNSPYSSPVPSPVSLLNSAPLPSPTPSRGFGANNSLLNRKNLIANRNNNNNGSGIKINGSIDSSNRKLGLNSSLLSDVSNLNQQRILQQKQQQEENDILLEEVKKLLEEQEEEEFANLETFNDYMPAKLKIGSRHPDQVVETASLASIPPPDVYYRLALPDEVIDEGRLSALQLESIIYASQQHETILPNNTRAGFLIGDGAGVGKGRTVAGIIYENYLQGRKRALWFSVSTDLKYDADRDLFDISAAKIDVHLLNKFKYGYKIHSPENDNVKRGIIFATYNSLIGESTSTSGKYSTRFNQIIQWCGEDFDGVIIFDECHKAKNLFPSGSTRATKTGQAVLELQRRLPRARVVYASATGATEPRNMGYMSRLGIWGLGTPFEDFNQFVSTVEKRGVGAMELVAIDLKMRGMYMARQLSFKGVNFRIEHVPLSREFIRIYNCCCRLWVSAKTKFEKALDLMGADHQVSKAVWTQFWAAHQRFFKYLCIASKVKFAVAFVKEALRCNKSVVIGLQSTGEARTMEQLEDNGGELNDFVSTAKSVFQSLIEKHFPAPNRKKLAKLLGEDTSFFDQLGIKLSRNENDEIVTSYVDDEDGTIFGKNSKINRAKNFYQNEEDSDDEDDDFVDVDEYDEGIVAENEDEDDDDSDMDSDDLSDIDDIMDEKLGLKRPRKSGAKKNNSLKFMDILLGPSAAAGNSKIKRKPNKKKKMKTNSASSAAAAVAAAKRKSMRIKYEKFYNDFDNVGEDVGAYCERLRDELLQQLESFGERLPPNTLDELIDELGGPENVAEMTGRKGRIVTTEEGTVQYEARTENDVSLEMLNLVEKQRFMDDDKRVAIISEAASSGISLHADRRAKNRWRRVHLTVELPWSADRAIQQFGRTHRSNQVSAPEYVFLISNLAGENRFASIVAKRLESLGALTHGDRRAAESRDLSQFNIDTKYGRQALEIVMKTIAGHSDVKPLVEPPDTYSGDDWFEDCREGLAGVAMLTVDRKTKAVSLDKDFGNINKFLNRLLGMEVELQNSLFRYFNQTMDAVIKQAKRHGRYDSGIIDLSSDIGNVSKLNEEKFILKSASGATKIQLHTVLIDRGLSYEKAHNQYEQALYEDDYFKDDIGFYVSNSTLQIRKTIFLAIPENAQKNKDIKQIFRIYKPSLGLQSKYETKSTLRERGEKIENVEDAQKLWSEHYELSEEQCSHMLLFGRCRQTTHATTSAMLSSSKKCDVGLRKRTYCILSGSVLTVWPDIEKTIPSIQHHKLQIVRLKTDDGFKYIGPMIPPFLVDDVRNCLNNLSNPTPKPEN